MLQIVAMPVQETELQPGPWYSTMAPVPPLTVKMSATLSMMSFGEVHPDNFPEKKETETLKVRWNYIICLTCQFDTDDLGALQFPRDVSHYINGVGTTHSNAETAKAATVGCVWIRTDHKEAGERVVFQDNLMDNT